jgi:UDP-glucuronate 4-epimerase
VVYGNTGPDAIREDRSLSPGTTYAASKVAGEALVDSFRREWGLSAASLRLTRVYGPYRRANCFLRQALIDHAEGRTTIIPCDPEFGYHYLYVGDVVDAVAATLAAPVLRHAAYNVTSSEVLTMPQVAETISQILPLARIELVPGCDDAPEEQRDFALGRITADTDWQPNYPLARGFQDYMVRFTGDRHIAD